MAVTHFSGPVNTTLGVVLGSTTTALLPAAASNTGRMMVISDNGSGNDEFALVVSSGSAWVKVTTTALS